MERLYQLLKLVNDYLFPVVVPPPCSPGDFVCHLTDKSRRLTDYLPENAGQYVMPVLDTTAETLQPVWNSTAENFPRFWNATTESLQPIWDTAAEGLPVLFNAMTDVMTENPYTCLAIGLGATATAGGLYWMARHHEGEKELEEKGKGKGKEKEEEESTLIIDWEQLHQQVQPQHEAQLSQNAVPDRINSLKEIAAHKESSMSALNDIQTDALADIRRRYSQQLLICGGHKAVLEELKSYLIQKYFENPVKFNGKALPFEYQPDWMKEIYELYYQNPYHSAHRYLSVPNLWIHPEATNVEWTIYGTASAIIDDEDKDNIAMLWLAINDESFPLPQGYNRGDLRDLFTSQLAYLGREHNWDNTRENDNGTTSEYDDLTADRPSCSKGIRRRLVQFLMILMRDDETFRPLNEQIMMNKFQETLIGENARGTGLINLINRLNLKQLTEFKEALIALVVNLGKTSDLNEDEQKTFEQFTWATQTLHSFLALCETEYGTQRIRERAYPQPRLHEKIFDNYGQLILHYAENVFSIFYTTIDQAVAKRIHALELEKTKEDTMQDAPELSSNDEEEKGEALPPSSNKQKRKRQEKEKNPSALQNKGNLLHRKKRKYQALNRQM